MAIGNYIHYRYQNYLRYGLNQNTKSEMSNTAITKLFQDQKNNMLTQIRQREREKNINIEDLQTQLNYYYGAQKEQIYGNISEQDLKDMHTAIEMYLGKKLDNIQIDHNTLRQTVSKYKDVNQEILQIKNEYEKTIEEELKSYVEPLGSSGGQINRKSLEKRINTLIRLRDELVKNKNSSKELIKNINALTSEWKYVQSLLNAHQNMSKNRISLTEKDTRTNRFVKDLNACISTLLKGSKTMHGEYAEAIVGATEYILNANGIKGVNNILAHLQKSVVGSTSKSKKGLKSTFFDADFVDLKQVALDSKKHFVDANDNIWTVNATQDKVDVIIEIPEMALASVKNYDLSNQYYANIHLLSGRSVIKLAQEYETFTNHYLNIMASHPDDDYSIIQHRSQAQLAMKATVLTKALVGGIISETGMNNQADIFIINDNSIGAFKVYFMSTILEKVFNNFSLLKTGELDSLITLNNNYSSDSKIRITNLISQLNNMELKVSIDKSVFLE